MVYKPTFFACMFSSLYRERLRSATAIRDIDSRVHEPGGQFIHVPLTPVIYTFSKGHFQRRAQERRTTTKFAVLCVKNIFRLSTGDVSQSKLLLQFHATLISNKENN